MKFINALRKRIIYIYIYRLGDLSNKTFLKHVKKLGNANIKSSV